MDAFASRISSGCCVPIFPGKCCIWQQESQRCLGALSGSSRRNIVLGGGNWGDSIQTLGLIHAALSLKSTRRLRSQAQGHDGVHLKTLPTMSNILRTRLAFPCQLPSSSPAPARFNSIYAQVIPLHGMLQPHADRVGQVSHEDRSGQELHGHRAALETSIFAPAARPSPPRYLSHFDVNPDGGGRADRRLCPVGLQ